jgi:hypothetical protein
MAKENFETNDEKMKKKFFSEEKNKSGKGEDSSNTKKGRPC